MKKTISLIRQYITMCAGGNLVQDDEFLGFFLIQIQKTHTHCTVYNQK